jgi:hypothetical protein
VKRSELPESVPKEDEAPEGAAEIGDVEGSTAASSHEFQISRPGKKKLNLAE